MAGRGRGLTFDYGDNDGSNAIIQWTMGTKSEEPKPLKPKKIQVKKKERVGKAGMKKPFALAANFSGLITPASILAASSCSSSDEESATIPRQESDKYAGADDDEEDDNDDDIVVEKFVVSSNTKHDDYYDSADDDHDDNGSVSGPLGEDMDPYDLSEDSNYNYQDWIVEDTHTTGKSEDGYLVASKLGKDPDMQDEDASENGLEEVIQHDLSSDELATLLRGFVPKKVTTEVKGIMFKVVDTALPKEPHPSSPFQTLNDQASKNGTRSPLLTPSRVSSCGYEADTSSVSSSPSVIKPDALQPKSNEEITETNQVMSGPQTQHVNTPSGVSSFQDSCRPGSKSVPPIPQRRYHESLSSPLTKTLGQSLNGPIDPHSIVDKNPKGPSHEPFRTISPKQISPESLQVPITSSTKMNIGRISSPNQPSTLCDKSITSKTHLASEISVNSTQQISHGSFKENQVDNHLSRSEGTSPSMEHSQMEDLPELHLLTVSEPPPKRNVTNVPFPVPAVFQDVNTIHKHSIQVCYEGNNNNYVAKVSGIGNKLLDQVREASVDMSGDSSSDKENAPSSESEKSQVDSKKEVRKYGPKRKRKGLTATPARIEQLSDDMQKNELEWICFKFLRKVREVIHNMDDFTVHESANALHELITEDPGTSLPRKKRGFLIVEEIVNQGTDLKKTCQDQENLVTLLSLLAGFNSRDITQDLKDALDTAKGNCISTTYDENYAEKISAKFCHFLGRLYAGTRDSGNALSSPVERYVTSLADKWIIFNRKGTTPNVEAKELLFTKCLLVLMEVIGPYMPEMEREKLYDTIEKEIMGVKPQKVKEILLQIRLNAEKSKTPTNSGVEDENISQEILNWKLQELPLSPGGTQVGSHIFQMGVSDAENPLSESSTNGPSIGYDTGLVQPVIKKDLKDMSFTEKRDVCNWFEYKEDEDFFEGVPDGTEEEETKPPSLQKTKGPPRQKFEKPEPVTENWDGGNRPGFVMPPSQRQIKRHIHSLSSQRRQLHQDLSNATVTRETVVDQIVDSSLSPCAGRLIQEDGDVVVLSDTDEEEDEITDVPLIWGELSLSGSGGEKSVEVSPNNTQIQNISPALQSGDVSFAYVRPIKLYQEEVEEDDNSALHDLEKIAQEAILQRQRGGNLPW